MSAFVSFLYIIAGFGLAIVSIGILRRIKQEGLILDFKRSYVEVIPGSSTDSFKYSEKKMRNRMKYASISHIHERVFAMDVAGSEEMVDMIIEIAQGRETDVASILASMLQKRAKELANEADRLTGGRIDKTDFYKMVVSGEKNVTAAAKYAHSMTDKVMKGREE